MKRRLLRIYRFYGLAWIIGLYAQMIWIFTASSETGLRTGVYYATLLTHNYGENWPEYVGMLSAVPAILLIVYDYLKTLKPRE